MKPTRSLARFQRLCVPSKNAKASGQERSEEDNLRRPSVGVKRGSRTAGTWVLEPPETKMKIRLTSLHSGVCILADLHEEKDRL